MNTINSNIGNTLAMEGHSNYNLAQQTDKASPVYNDAAKVVENIAETNANIKEDVQQLQRLSDMVMGRKLQFNVNNELGSVVIKIVDPNTNQVIITNLVNNTEFYKYTKPPSCLMPNNSDLNYMY